ncbi:MAG: YfcE family phosphodiesterase [Crocinitomicaceae bacterium]|nr:YfcE family phosphodiesterase [Crocinitomicaceae bacterium]
MVKIGLISDTHGFLDQRVFHHFKDVDEIWHAGDIGDIAVTDKLEAFKPLRAVYGNIDNHVIRVTHPLHQRFTIENTDVWITHIGGYPNRYAPPVREEIYNNPPDLFICGHSHILKVMYDKDINCLHMNPGAAGNHGFQKVRTLIRFTIDNGEFKDVEVIELGPKDFSLPNAID